MSSPKDTRMVQEKSAVQQMGSASVFEVSSELVAIRSSCLERLKFEVEYGRKRGTTENAYLLKGATREATVLIDVPSEPFAASFRTSNITMAFICESILTCFKF